MITKEKAAPTRSRKLAALAGGTLISLLLGAVAAPVKLEFAPAPVDNPLKGLVPYVSASEKERFPQSMEFRYFSLQSLLKGPAKLDWSPIEKTLQLVGGRGHQLILRIYCEYPEHGDEVPEFLKRAGVKVTVWKDEEGAKCYNPDYRNPVMRKALVDFIAAFGKKYDGDPRIAYITAGLLGAWGEWHNYPHDELWAPKEVQREVMDAYEKAFTKTKVLMRYPAGPKTYWHAANNERPFGYHDDSFCWATLDTGRDDDDWFFEPSMKSAGATEKWRTQPIGGELRPELWKKSFTAQRHKRDQGFVKCVERMHATWLMDTGLFDAEYALSAERKAIAMKEVARMGYELHISQAEWNDGELSLTVENRGVAPFYYDWGVEIQQAGVALSTVPVGWKLSQVLPGKPVGWKVKIDQSAAYRLQVRNPMKGGKPLRFANKEQGEGWLRIEME
jgi:hypothetical protein